MKRVLVFAIKILQTIEILLLCLSFCNIYFLPIWLGLFSQVLANQYASNVIF